jgi:hypothetical protein
MPLARRQATCLTANAFRIDRALQQLYFSHALLRPFSTRHRTQHIASAEALNHSASIDPATAIEADDVSSEPDGYDAEEDRLESHQILAQALAALRRKNRGTEHTSFRKVNTTKLWRCYSIGSEPKKTTPDQNKSNIIKTISSPSRSGTRWLRLTKALEKSPAEIPQKRIAAKETSKGTPFQKFKRSLPAFDHLFDSVDEIPGGRTAGLSASTSENLAAILDYKGYPVKLRREEALKAESLSTPWMTKYDGLDGLQAYVL